MVARVAPAPNEYESVETFDEQALGVVSDEPLFPVLPIGSGNGEDTTRRARAVVVLIPLDQLIHKDDPCIILDGCRIACFPDVDAAARAAQYGLLPDDVFLEVNDAVVNSESSVVVALKSALRSRKSEVRVKVQRQLDIVKGDFGMDAPAPWSPKSQEVSISCNVNSVSPVKIEKRVSGSILKSPSSSGTTKLKMKREQDSFFDDKSVTFSEHPPVVVEVESGGRAVQKQSGCNPQFTKTNVGMAVVLVAAVPVVLFAAGVF